MFLRTNILNISNNNHPSNKTHKHAHFFITLKPIVPQKDATKNVRVSAVQTSCCLPQRTGQGPLSILVGTIAVAFNSLLLRVHSLTHLNSIQGPKRRIVIEGLDRFFFENILLIIILVHFFLFKFL